VGKAGNPVVAVAFIRVLEMLEQVVPLVSKIAPAQLSFDGGAAAAVRQILKLEAVPSPEGFVPKLAILTK
jgi:hypothetical protein